MNLVGCRVVSRFYEPRQVRGFLFSASIIRWSAEVLPDKTDRPPRMIDGR